MRILMLPCSMFSLLSQREYILQNELNSKGHRVELLNIMPTKTWDNKGDVLGRTNINVVNRPNGTYDVVLLSRTNYAENIISYVMKNNINKKTKLILTDEGTFTVRDLPNDIKYLRKQKGKNIEYFTIFDKVENTKCKVATNDLRFMKQQAVETDFSFDDSGRKAVVIVGTGLLRKLPMSDVNNYFKNVIDKIIELFPNNVIVYPFHQITRGETEQLIYNRYKDKVICRRFYKPTDLLITDKNTEAVISTFSTVTSSVNTMFPEIKQYYPDEFDYKLLAKGEKSDLLEGLEISKDYQIKYNSLKPLSSLKV